MSRRCNCVVVVMMAVGRELHYADCSEFFNLVVEEAKQIKLISTSVNVCEPIHYPIS